MRRKNFLAGSFIAVVLSFGVLAPTHAEEAQRPCGFSPVATGNVGGGESDKHYEKAIYNHCSHDGSNTKVQVDYTYANDVFCVTPGETEFRANPDLGAITNIFSIGGC